MSSPDMSKFHELANAFPLMEGAEFGELIADIDDNGLLSPVVMYDGKILDGRNRWRACQRLGIPHTEKQFTGDDPAAYVWSVNAVRRQLTASQRALAATKLVTAKAGDNRHTVSDKVTTAEAAKIAGVGPRTAERARKVVADAIPEVTEAVEKGELSVNTAEMIAQRPEQEQQEIMGETPVAELPGRMAAAQRPRKPRRTADVPDTGDLAAETDPEGPRGPGRGHVGPRVQMERQMDQSSAEGAKLRTRMWAENKDEISSLDPEALAGFVADLKTTRRAIEQLLKLINLEKDRNQAVKDAAAENDQEPEK